MWRKIILGAACAAFSGSLARAEDAAGNAPVPTNEALPPNLPPSIGFGIPALADFKKGLLNLGYNFQLNYTGDVLGNPLDRLRHSEGAPQDRRQFLTDRDDLDTQIYNTFAGCRVVLNRLQWQIAELRANLDKFAQATAAMAAGLASGLIASRARVLRATRRSRCWSH